MNAAHESEFTPLVSVLSRLSGVCLFATPWSVARQAPLSMGFSRQECWSGQAILFSRGSSQPRGKLDLLHCRHILYHLSLWGGPDSSLLRA